MKIRVGFVTNSSSSNFILAFKDMPELPKELVEQYPELEGYTELMQSTLVNPDDYMSDEDDAFPLTEQAEVVDFFMEHVVGYGWGTRSKESLDAYLADNPEDKAVYDAIMQRLKEGYSVIVRKVPYSKRSSLKIIRGLVKAGKIEDLRESEG